MSLSNNSGSLPDLTNLNFPSPLVMPLDVEPSPLLTQDSGLNDVPVTTSCYTNQMDVTSAVYTAAPAMSGRLQRQMVPVPLILHGSNQLLTGIQQATAENQVTLSFVCACPLYVDYHRNPETTLTPSMFYRR